MIIGDVSTSTKTLQYFVTNLPTTMVSSGISSIKHFFSVSPMWKYNAETVVMLIKAKNSCGTDMLNK